MTDASLRTSDARARVWLVDLVGQRHLPPSQRRVVQHILDSLPEIGYSSALEVAQSAGVSQATVTRVANALGFEGYQELRSRLRGLLLETDGVQATGAADPTHALLETERRNVAALDEVISGPAFEQAAQLLVGSVPFGVVGFRASAAIADYFGYFARRVLPGVHVIEDASSVEDHLLQLQLSGASAVLFFAMPRYPAVTVEAIRSAKRLGLTTIVVSDTILTPFAADTDIGLVAPVGSTLVFDSHAAAVVLSIALLDRIASINARQTQARLEAHEEIVARWAR